MNFKKLISNQLFIIVTALFPIIVFGFLTYQNLKVENEKTSVIYIKDVNMRTNEVIQTYFKTVQFNINNLAHTISYLEKQVEKNILNLQSMQKKHIVDYYRVLDEHLLALSQKDIFQYVYSFKNREKIVLEQYIEDLKNYVNLIDTPNLLMINPQGMILYSSNKPELLNKNAQNITPAFTQIWGEVKKLQNYKQIIYTQISYNKYSKKYEQYLITRFKDVDGYVAIEVDMSHIQEDLFNVSSLGSTAETYLVYKENDKTYLAYDRHTKKEKQGDEKSNPFIELGFTSSNITTKRGSTNKIEVVGYTPIKIRNITYSMQTTVSYIDIISPKIHNENYFEHFVKGYNYKNLLLIANNGDVFYSTEQKDEHTGNIFSGIDKETFFAHAVQEVFQKKQFVLTKLQKNPACEDSEQSQYALMPILSEENRVETIVAIELNNNVLQEHLKPDRSIYKSTSTYILSQNNELKLTPTKTPIKENNHNDLLETNSTINFSHVHWNLFAQIEKKDISANLHSLKLNIYLFLLISIFIATVSMYIITNEKKKNDKKLKHQVMHDNLTNLPNRRYAIEFLENTLANTKRNKTKGAVLFIDLDKFKTINDTHGHKAGDKVLVEIAKRFKEVVRENDLVARLGGDEFLIILNRYEQLHDIDSVCKKLLSAASEEIIEGNNSYIIGLSIGIATFPYDSTHATELLTYADTAMYVTKDKGRNNYTYYDQKMMEASLKEAKLEQEIHKAITHNELVLHYQPQIQLSDLSVIGVEALVRWNHPTDGLVMPNHFIPIAENSKLIVELGYWVLKQACKDFKSWQAQGYNIEYVAVNMSIKQLESNDCVSMVLSILNNLDFNPKNLELEITETTLISNFENTIENINTFKAYGIKFSIDDFGTGYSSLAYLKSLHISTLKIDREFIQDILTNRDDRTIVTAIIAMGHALGYTIITEGAEEKAEIELLRYLACDTIQGYYFSKPLPAQKLLEFIDKGIHD